MNMDEHSGSGELQQLVQKEESEEPLSRGDEVTPPCTPTKSNKQSKGKIHSPHELQQVIWENNAQSSSALSKESSSQATTSYGNQSRLVYSNDKEKQKSVNPEVPNINKQRKVLLPCKHHSFLSEVPDVRHMEQALLQLLEDFHSGNLRAFGKDCSMEQMIEIREQQEKLARLHFEMGQRQDIHEIEQSSFRQSSANMLNLLQRLEQLSVCIEKLHSK
ncbi:PREDICTED: coiled-coil domain-containing protein 28A-like isoform X1 [Ceratosolen solmsi marchali]|uniref:Coiled-coil domain-containing protein 28A-like isoform X1 n=1 Tax=Ceratosolen solmsi marchali TaxID=326594 RepID=A0AAJ6YJ43_9HYME|nr:PREDICTED: coiled-coil domain-containing protein 28A-like isoform X1 [Ceratosolen solmsi marchali]